MSSERKRRWVVMWVSKERRPKAKKEEREAVRRLACLASRHSNVARHIKPCLDPVLLLISRGFVCDASWVDIFTHTLHMAINGT